MKTLNEYMALPYKMEIIEDQEEGGFVVSFPDLPGCITCGDTVESAIANANDAKKAWLEAALEEGLLFTSRIDWRIIPDSLNYVFQKVYIAF